MGTASMRISCFALALASAYLAAPVEAHGALFIPAPRNSEDRNLPQFAGGKNIGQNSTPGNVGVGTACTCSNGLGGPDGPKKGCERGLRADADGQACLWWSQGCSIGCDVCATAAGG